MSGRSSRPKRVSGFILCCEVCALQLQATWKPPVRLGMIWSSPACILWHVPTQRGFQFHAVRMEGTPGNCSCSRPVHLQGSLAAGFLCWPALWHCWQWEGVFAHTCTSASSSVVQAHILGQVREKKKKVFNCSYGRQHQLWLAFVMQNSGKKSTQGGWELGRIFGPSFVWGRLVSGMVIRVTADDAWEDAAVSSSVVRENCTSVSELDRGVDWDWDEPDLVWWINMWCTERPELPNWDSAMNKSIFEERTSELSRFSKKNL